jgi:hypothetical protein
MDDGTPICTQGCSSEVVGFVPIRRPTIRTRQANAIDNTGFAFSIGDSPFMGLYRNNPESYYIRSGINTTAAVEVVVVSQGLTYAGTTLFRANYTVVCAPLFEFPPDNEIYPAYWNGDPTPVGTFTHDIPSLGTAPTSSVILSASTNDAHSSAANWGDVLETVIPIVGTNATAYLALIHRAAKWTMRQRPHTNEYTHGWPIRTYITARAPYLTGGAGCSLNILGAYVRAVY